MKKVKLMVTETFRSSTEQEKKDQIQKAVDQYILMSIHYGDQYKGLAEKK